MRVNLNLARCFLLIGPVTETSAGHSTFQLGQLLVGNSGWPCFHEFKAIVTLPYCEVSSLMRNEAVWIAMMIRHSVSPCMVVLLAETLSAGKINPYSEYFSVETDICPLCGGRIG